MSGGAEDVAETAVWETEKTGRRFYPPSHSDIPAHGPRIYADLHRERIRAHQKHDTAGKSMERAEWDDPRWMLVLLEEVGEVARELIEHYGQASVRLLREELVQVGAMTAAWIDAIDLREGE